MLALRDSFKGKKKSNSSFQAIKNKMRFTLGWANAILCQMHSVNVKIQYQLSFIKTGFVAVELQNVNFWVNENPAQQQVLPLFKPCKTAPHSILCNIFVRLKNYIYRMEINLEQIFWIQTG